MNIEKIVRVSELLDFYGGLLTEKQREAMELYYNEDLSLSEISENLGISRQAVYDTIKRSQKSLEEYESKIGLLDRFSVQEKKLEKLHELIENAVSELDSKDVDRLKDSLIGAENFCRELLR